MNADHKQYVLSSIRSDHHCGDDLVSKCIANCWAGIEVGDLRQLTKSFQTVYDQLFVLTGHLETVGEIGSGAECLIYSPLGGLCPRRGDEKDFD